MLWCFERFFDESLVNHELRFVLANQAFLPRCDLAPHRIEIALHAVNADRYRIDEAEMFRVLGNDRPEVPVERHVVADEDSVAYGHREAHGLVVGIPDADREPASFESGFEVEDAEHLHPVLGDGVLVPGDRYVPEGKRLGKRVDDEVVSERVVAFRAFWRRNDSQLFPSDLVAAAVGKQLSLIHQFFSFFQGAMKGLSPSSGPLLLGGIWSASGSAPGAVGKVRGYAWRETTGGW